MDHRYRKKKKKKTDKKHFVKFYALALAYYGEDKFFQKLLRFGL